MRLMSDAPINKPKLPPISAENENAQLHIDKYTKCLLHDCEIPLPTYYSHGATQCHDCLSILESAIVHPDGGQVVSVKD